MREIYMQPVPEPEQESENILSELAAYPNFVTWQYREINGRVTKPPFSPLTGEFADPTDPSTWSDLQTALAALKTGRYEGLGFVFSPDDPFLGIDLDHCVEPNGSIQQWAAEIITQINSYSEFSPSGTGVHILARGSVPAGRRRENTECYSEGRYFTLTLNHLEGTSATIEERPEQIQALYERLAPPKQETSHTVFSLSRRDDEILEKAMGAKNGDSFKSLYNGDTSGFKSKSEADFTLVLRLLYWTNDDIQQTERLFRQSGLYDEKTDRPTHGMTYLQYTIQNALKKRQR